jgi:aryl-alcohol dehydrogenase-like predicted oxidoreductase
MPKTQPPLSSVLPPLIFGTATFNYQYNPDPFALPSTSLVHRALSSGISAFDTSPYYGPSESILGAALAAPTPPTHAPWPRASYTLITKVGRIASASFDYSPAWVRQSIARSLQRLRTDYLDLVYCHDVEFVTPAEVLAAVRELRRIRDEDGRVRYVGISGYPVGVLCELAEMVRRETGEPLDAVQSYANYTLQSTLLASSGVARFKQAGVDVVPNASILGMGLLRSQGVPAGTMGDWHPSPNGLREACGAAARYCGDRNVKLESVATRWALETWLDEGAEVGTTSGGQGTRVGVSVIGVSNLPELEEAVGVWKSILAERGGGGARAEEASTEELAKGIREVLGTWKDFAWDSPGSDFVRKEVTENKESI